jgi:hypothetical protein
LTDPYQLDVQQGKQSILLAFFNKFFIAIRNIKVVDAQDSFISSSRAALTAASILVESTERIGRMYVVVHLQGKAFRTHQNWIRAVWPGLEMNQKNP